MITQLAKGSAFEEDARDGATALILVTGIPIVLGLVFACVFPDLADMKLASKPRKRETEEAECEPSSNCASAKQEEVKTSQPPTSKNVAVPARKIVL